MKKTKKNKIFNQTSFYFEDYLETNKKKLSKQLNSFHDRIYLLFFFFFSLILIFSIKITHISLIKNIFNLENQKSKFSLIRRDIVDRNGAIISRNINTFHVVVDPKLIKIKNFC